MARTYAGAGLRRSVRRSLFAATAAAGALLAGQALADENGASIYLLGSGGPAAAVLPPVEGVFLSNTLYYYSGKTGGSKDFQIGGGIVANVKGTISADFATALWVPTTRLGGGTLALGLSLPFGNVNVDATSVITGPAGRTLGLAQSDEAFVVGDPLVTAIWGFNRGDTHVQFSTLVNIPIGDYHEGEMANLAFHRWAVDASLAVSWHNVERGWDVSGKAGVTFNGDNEDTHYDSGDDFHLEGAVERTFNPAFSAGLQGYYFDQLSGDSGSGARLGAFKGRVAGLGATAAYNFKIAEKIPATLRFHAIHEFNAVNRMEGNAFFLDFNMPLWVPSAAAPK